MLARVKGIVISAEPLKLVAVPTPSPEIAIVLAVCRAAAVEAFPVKAAVIVPALKLPDASLNTNVETVFAFVPSIALVSAKVFLAKVLEPTPTIKSLAAV